MGKENVVLMRGREIKLGTADGIKDKVKQIVHELHALRTLSVPGKPAQDITLREHLALQYETSPEHLYHSLGIDPNHTTVDFLLTVDDSQRWLVPELFRDAIRLGLLRAPIYPNLIASSETIANPSITMPSFNPSDAVPDDLSEGQTIGEGTVTYQSKDVKIRKQAIGLKLSYEAIQYTSISLLSLFLQDLGSKLGRKLDQACISVLLNGDQANGSQSAASFGTKTGGTQNVLDYASIVKAWVRMQLIGRQPNAALATEAGINEWLNLAEFKNRYLGTPLKQLNLKTPIPQDQDVFTAPAGSALGDHQILFVDSTRAIVQLTSAPLLVENEKIVQRQLDGTYASITTGFANVFRDGRLMLDTSLTVGTDFPTWLNKG
jgi:hypothetical protein